MFVIKRNYNKIKREMDVFEFKIVIKIVLYEGKLIYFVIMVIVFYFDRYFELCDFYFF